MNENTGSRRSQLKKSGRRMDLLDHRQALRKSVEALEATEDFEERLGRGGARRSPPLKILLPLLAAVALAIVIPVGMSLTRDGGGKGARNQAALRVVDAENAAEEQIDAAAVGDLSGEEVARAFLEARSWERRRRWIREPGDVMAHLIRYPEEVLAFPIGFEELRPMGAVMPGGLIRYERFGVRMAGGGMRFLCVVDTAAGPRVDYDAFARYATAGWDELHGGQAGDEVRVMVVHAADFRGRFRDATRWTSFKLSCPDWPAPAGGYAERGSVTEAVLSEIVKVRPQRVTLALRPEGDSHSTSQFVIERVVINGWVRTPRDPEEAWRMRGAR